MMTGRGAHGPGALKPASERNAGREKRSERSRLVDGLLENPPHPDGTGLETEERSRFTSMEDLLSDFSQKLNECFGHFDGESEVFALVTPLAEDAVLQTDEVWSALTDNYGNVMPVDWNQSYARSLYRPTLNTMDKPRPVNVNVDVSDDEDLREQMDLHSIIVACFNEEPFLTAEQVIEEIEEMMRDSPDMEAKQNTLQLNLTHRSTRHIYEQLKSPSVAELNELLEEVEATIHHYSEELVQYLALRDELDFEKEVKNSFISMLIEVQNRQKEHRELLKKKRKEKNETRAEHGRAARLPTNRFSMESISTAIQNGFRQTFGNRGLEKQYLTTVIPYEKNGGPPSVKDLQVLTTILQAMRDDSDKVPSLLTDYILKEMTKNPRLWFHG